MKKTKCIYISCIVLALCTLAIVIACVIFNDNNNGKINDPPSENTPVAIEFDYEDELTICLGEKLCLAPKEKTINLIYKTSNSEILTVDETGNVETKKCGEVEVKISNGIEEIKTVKILIKLNFEILNTNSCIFEEGCLVLESNFAIFDISFKNSLGEELKEGESIEVEGSENILAHIKVGSVWVNANEDGFIKLKITPLNYELTLIIKLTK